MVSGAQAALTAAWAGSAKTVELLHCPTAVQCFHGIWDLVVQGRARALGKALQAEMEADASRYYAVCCTLTEESLPTGLRELLQAAVQAAEVLEEA